MIQTSLNKEYVLRLTGVALLLAAAGGWFLFDGAITYPQTNASTAPVCEALAKSGKTARELLATDKGEVSLFAQAFLDAKVDVPSVKFDEIKSVITAGSPAADDVDYVKYTLARPVYADTDIRAQFTSALIAFAFAALLEIILLKRARTTYTLTEEALAVKTGPISKTYPLHALKALDDAQWESKNIIRATFDDTTLTLDAWHYQGVAEMRDLLKAKLPDDATLA